MVFVPSLLFSQTKIDEITSVVNNAKVLYDKGYINEAISLVKDNKRNFESVAGGKLLYHKMLGVYYATLSENDKSEKEFTTILSDSSINASKKDKAEACFGIASACLSRGDLRKAEETFTQSYQTYKELRLENDPYARNALAGLGTTYYFLKDYTKASQYFTNAKYLYEKNLDFSLEYVKCLSNYSLVLNEQKDFFWAKCMIDVARNSLRQLPVAHNVGIVFPMLSSMSTIYADMGYYDESMGIIQEGLAMCDNPNSPQTVLLYNNLAIHALIRKDYRASVKLLSKCLALADASQKEEIMFNLAYAQWLAKDREASTTTKNMSEAIINDVSSKFCFLSNSEREKYWNYYSPYIYILNSWLVQGKAEQDNASLYNNALFAKGLLLRTSNRVREHIANSENDEAKQQYEELLALHKLMEKRTLSNDAVMQIQERINAIDKNLTKLVQWYVSSADLRKEYDWRNIRKSLGVYDCAIEFMMIPSWEGDSINPDFDYYAAIIKSESSSPILVKLSKESEIKAVLSKTKSLPLNRYITNLYKWGSRTQGEKIYKKIWEPLEAYLLGVKNVYYSPVGVLNSISFNAIARDTVYIGQKYNLFQLTSTAQIKQVKENNKKMTLSTALIYGGVVYDAKESDLVAESRNYMADNKHVAWNVKEDENESTRSRWGYLPGTKIEAEAIYSRLDSAGIHSTLISGIKANEESFKNKTNGNDLIHIATHGFFLADKKEVALNPFVQALRTVDSEPSAMIRSGLLFAGANRTWTGNNAIADIEDGILTAEEISNVNLSSTKLVVLSACETGLGEIKSSEGVFGLQRAFKLAGVQSLIMSLWKVDDNATMLLMNTFYDNWMNGMTKHNAFNSAIDTIRKQYKSPYYWAAFVMLD